MRRFYATVDRVVARANATGETIIISMRVGNHCINRIVQRLREDGYESDRVLIILMAMSEFLIATLPRESREESFSLRMILLNELPGFLFQSESIQIPFD